MEDPRRGRAAIDDRLGPHRVQRAPATRSVWELTVRYDNGQFGFVTQDGEPDLKVGDRVRHSDNTLEPNTDVGLRVWADVSPRILNIRDTAATLIIRVYVENGSSHEITVVSGGPPYRCGQP